MRALENDVWLYEGPPDEIGLSVPDASPEQGGYVIVCELQNSELRMFATRFPTKCVNNWNSRSDRFAGQKLRHVMVSVPIIPYERAKKLLIQKLAQEPSSDGSDDDRKVPSVIATVKKQAESIFRVRSIETTKVAGYLQGRA